MAYVPQYTPLSGYGTQVGNYNYVQTSPSGGNWSTVPATPLKQSAPSTQILNAPATNNNPTPSNPNPAPSNDSGGGASDPARDAYFSYLDQQAGMLPETQRNLESQVNNLFTSNTSSINTGLTDTLENLDTSNKNITSNKVSSLRELDQDMINQLRAGNVYLGARGAGDSSAANQFSYALTKVGSQNRAGILKQANQLYAQVDTQINQAKRAAQDQLQQLNTWKNNQLLQIAQYIQGLRGQIDEQKANYIQGRLAQIDQQGAAYKQMLTQWVLERSQTLAQVKTQLQQLGVGPTVAFSNPSLPGMAFGGNLPSTGTNLYGSYSQKKPEDIYRV